MFQTCLVLKVIIFSKLISLIYFNVFIEDFELLMLVSSLIYLLLFAFCTGNKVVFLLTAVCVVVYHPVGSGETNNTAFSKLMQQLARSLVPCIFGLVVRHASCYLSAMVLSRCREEGSKQETRKMSFMVFI